MVDKRLGKVVTRRIPLTTVTNNIYACLPRTEEVEGSELRLSFNVKTYVAQGDLKKNQLRL